MYRLQHRIAPCRQLCAQIGLRLCATKASAVTVESTSSKQNATTTTTVAAAAVSQAKTAEKVDPKLDALAASYAQLTLKQLSDLQRLIFKKMGHSDDFYEKALLRSLGGGNGGGGAPMMMMSGNGVGANGGVAASPGDGNGGGASVEKVEKKKVEKNTFDVKLGPYAPEIKIKLIKQLRAVTNMTIVDAKKAVEKCPGLVVTNMARSDAEKLKGLFDKLGATVELI